MKNKTTILLLSLIMMVNLITVNVQATSPNGEKNNINIGVGDINIISTPNITVEQAQDWARSVTNGRATEAFINLAPLYKKYAESRGNINWAIAYVQAAKETGYGQFGGVLTEDYYNPCGLKNPIGGSDYDPNAHKKFDNWDQGVIAHLDHLALYAGSSGYPKSVYADKYKEEGLAENETYDPRHSEGWYPSLYGTATTILSLGGNQKWNSNINYGADLFRMYCQLTNTKYLEAKSNLDSISEGQVIEGNSLLIRGWALHAFGVNEVKVLIDGENLDNAEIGLSRPDVNKVYPDYFNSINSGFEKTYDISNISKGKKVLTIQVVARDGSVQTITRNVIFKEKETEENKLQPRSNLDLPKEGQTTTGSTLQIGGWALHSTGIKQVKVSIDGKYMGDATIGGTREDVNNAYPGYPNGNKSGFNASIDISNISNGTKKVKVEIIANDNSVQTYERNIKINKINLQSRSWLDTPSEGEVLANDTINIGGWALSSSGIKEVKVYLDGTFMVNAITGILRSDVNSAYPGYPNGDKSGFQATINASNIKAGTKKITVEIISNDNTKQSIERNIVLKKSTLVVVDPGHEIESVDPGAIATHSGIRYVEGNLNLQIAVKLKAELEARGIEVYMTRYDSVIIDRDSTESLKKRVKVANDINADLFVSIHHNSFTSTSANGFEVYYSTGTPITTYINEKVITEDGRDLTLETRAYASRSTTDKVIVSRSLATAITNEASSTLGLYNRGAKDSNLYVCKNTKMPSILIENGFLTNPTEAVKVSSLIHQQKLAEIVADNINKTIN